MENSSVLVFGNNEYGIEIAKNVKHKHSNITVFGLDDNDGEEKDYQFAKFDLSDHWDELNQKYDMENSIIFCALKDEAQNIFLTISLRSAFADTTIIALAKNDEDSNKLHMAGATKVIPIVETTANIITDMLKKPIVTQVLHGILYEDSDLRIIQVEVHNAECFGGEYPADINWSRDHGVLVLSIIHQDGTHEFIYSSKAKHNEITNGDIFVVVGYEHDIQEFKKFIGEEKCKR
ncbi:NAD-binding protein [Sulfurimonas microaerophilic]|uniref:NAD-binding protein n=1 Tax=Sulfurimonas microaerophilic TaxID=3058392 RepID=UPI002714ED5B|nr:NAD-binding protein [Sulfurimonas sp. hsl 1-7]